MATPPRSDVPRLDGSPFLALVFLTSVVLVAAGLRLHFGVDFTDEAYYASIPYRFALGDVPYVSDLSVRQNAGVLTTPLVWLWVKWNGTDGLILFLRYVYFAVRVALFVFAAQVLRTRVPFGLALTSALVICAFVLFGIPALSYNTLSGSFITAAFLFTLSWSGVPRASHALGAAACAILAAFVHPMLTPVSLATCIALLPLAPTIESRRTAVRILLAVGLVTAAALVAMATLLGRENLAYLLAEAGWYTGPAASVRSLIRIPGQMLLSRGGIVVALAWLALWWPPFAQRRIAVPLIAGYAVMAMLPQNEVAMFWLAIGSLPLAFSLRRSGEHRDLMVVATLSVVAGVTVALFSTNGVGNAPVGSEAAVLIFFVFAQRIVSERAPRSRWATSAVTMLAVVSVCRFSVGQWRNIYRDDPVQRLTSVVPTGPYQGIRTTPMKLGFLQRVQSGLRDHASGHATLMAFNGFPAAHLFVPLRAALPVTWIADYPVEYVQRMREALARSVKRARKPILVLQLFRLPMTSTSEQRWDYANPDPLLEALSAERPRLRSRNAEYAIYDVLGRDVQASDTIRLMPDQRAP